MPHFAQGRALVIGVGTYSNSAVHSVPVTAREAVQVAAALQEAAVAAYPPTQVQLVTNSQTTKANLVAALRALSRQAGPDDTVFIFFSGYGALGDDGKYDLGTHDVELATPTTFRAGTGLSQDELLAQLGAIPSKKLLLIVNACSSANLTPTLGAAAPQDEFLGAPPQRVLDQWLGSGEGRAIITASRDGQPCYFDPNQSYTFFGQALIDGLRGEGIVTRGGYLGLVELYEYIYTRVLAATPHARHPQEPMLSILRGVGTFPVAYARGASTTIPDVSLLRALLPDERGVRLVDTPVEPNVGAGNQGLAIPAGSEVNVGRDMIGGDKVIHGDEYSGTTRVDRSNKADVQTGANTASQVNTVQTGNVAGNFIFAPSNTTTIYTDTNQDQRAAPPAPPFGQLAWWKWMAQYRRMRLILYVLAGVLGITALSAFSGVPTVEGWKPISNQNLGDAKWITRIDQTLFVMPETDGICHTPRDPGLWRSLDGGVKWEPILIDALDFPGSNRCDRSSIIAIAPSPEHAGRLYAATADVGLLVSDTNGATWNVLNKDLERVQLSGLAVLASPERLYVVGRVPSYFGLYTSLDGAQWTRLDGGNLCATDGLVSLPSPATVNAQLVAQAGYLYIAPADSSKGAPPEADIYFSGDGGICWKRVHQDGTKQTVTALAAFPGSNSQILYATLDYSGLLGLGRSISYWQWDAESEKPLAQLILGPHQLYIDAEDGYWYGSTPLGLVYRGSLQVPENPTLLAGPFAKYAAFTSDFESERPLLLRGGRVFRRGTVGWWQGFFP